MAAAPSIRTDPHYLIDTWETEDGLPENSATAVAQDQDGYLWIGTFAGLVRFDGLTFTRFEKSNTPGLPSDGIVNLHLDRRGRLWVSTYRGLALREGTGWRVIGASESGTGDLVRTFSERANGDLLLTTFDGDVLEVSDEKIRRLPRPPGPGGPSYFGHADEAGTWWVVRNDFVGSWDGRQWVGMLSPSSSLRPEDVASGAARDGGMWLLLGRELRKYRKGEQVRSIQLPELPGGNWKISEDCRGNVWIATHDKGVCRVSPGGDFSRWTTANGLSYNGTRFAFEDREQNVWVGTSGGGLQRFKPRRFQSIGLESGLTERLVRSVSPARGGGTWIATYGKGLFRWHDGKATAVPLPAGDSAYVQSVMTDRAGRTWIGTYVGGLYLLENGAIRHIPAEQTGGNNVIMLFEDAGGRVWIAGGQTVAVSDGTSFRTYTTAEGSPSGAVWFAQDGDGVVWLANADGVFRFVNGKFDEVRDGDRPITGVTCIQGDKTGAIWAALGNSGFLHWRGNTLTRVAGVGPPDCKIRAILEDGSGVFWMPSTRGILRVRRDELLASAHGKATPAVQVLDLEDGLPSVEFPESNQPICARDGDGRLWFATSKGVATLDPANFSLHSTPPAARIESFGYHTSPYDGIHTASTAAPRPGGAGVVRMSAPFTAPHRLPAGSHWVEISYTAPSFSAPSKVQFQVKLDGVDTQWRDVGNQRVAYYHDPRPGNYVFRVRAANSDGIRGTADASVAFTVQPFFWETLWFRLGLPGALPVAVAGVTWWVSVARHRRERQRLDRARLQSAALLRLVSSPAATTGDVRGAVREICQVCADAAGVDRVSVSLVDDAEGGLACSDVFDRVRGVHRSGPALTTARFPRYFDALWSGGTINAEDARHDERVSELAAEHLIPDGVCSVLDSGARAAGRLVGVVRFAQLGRVRKWRDDEIGFSTAVADHLAQVVLNAAKEKAVGQLRESEERFRLMADTAPVMIWRSGADKRADFFNTPWLRFTGRPLEQEVGDGWQADVHPDDRERVVHTYASAFDAREEFQTEFRKRRHDGEYRWVLGTGTPRFASDGRFEGYIGSCIDITERKQADELVRQSQARFRQVFEAAPTGMLMIDENGRVILANAQAERMFGYSGAELLQLDADTLVPARFRGPPDGDRRGIFAPHRVHAGDADGELFGLRADGTEFPVEVGVNQIGSAAGSFILSTVTDLTARRRAESEAREQRDELAHLSRVTMLGELSGSLAHELNQPLAAILSNAQAAQRFLAHDDFDVAELRDILKDIVDEDKRAGEVIQRLRLLLKKGEISRQPLDLNEVVLDVLKIVRSDLVNRAVVVETELDERIPSVMADRVQVQQVLLNLLTNACDAMADNSSEDRSVVVRTHADDGSAVRVSVVDRGAGISEGALGRIFEPFVTTKSHGMGLGLAVCRTIITAHGGALSAMNNADRGARFDLTLPTGSLP